MTSLELFKYLDGYSYDKTNDNAFMLLNSFPDYQKELKSVKVLTQMNGNTLISDVLGKKASWNSEIGHSSNDLIEKSYDGLKSLIKSGDKVYLLTAKNPLKPVKLDVDPSAHWAVNNKYLYWTKSDEKMFYIYNTENMTYRKIDENNLKNNAVNGLNEVSNADILQDYKRGDYYERISFTNQAMEGNYSRIKRRGKVVIEGNLLFSPSKNKIVFYMKGEGYYFANADGTGRKFLGNANFIKWINNNKIFMTIDDKNYIVKNNGRTITETQNEWRYLGVTPTNEVLFSINNTLYMEKEGKETELMKLPWLCDRIVAQKAKGPYVAVVNSNESVFLINQGVITKMGTERFDNAGYQKESITKNLNITFSPDGREIAYFQQEDKLLSFNIIHIENKQEKKILLDFPFDSGLGYQLISTKWISDKLVLVFSNSKWCAINLEKETELYQQTMPRGSALFGVLN